MDLKPETLSAVRSYVFDYVTGILWLVTAVVAFGFSEAFSAMTAMQAGPKIPDLALAFLLAIGGVVIPYCASVALKPVSLRLMTALLRVHRGIESKRAKASIPGPTRSLEQMVADHVCGELRWNGRIERAMIVTFVRARRPRLASYIEKERDEIWFRASAVLPSSLFFAVATFRVSEGHPWLSSIVIGVLVFLSGTWSVNRELWSWHDNLRVAALLSDAHTNAP